MGFSSVYRSLTEIFPQIDVRILKAVAREHPKDADEAAAIVLSDIVPNLPSNVSHNSTHSWNKSSGSISEHEVERGLEDVVSRCRYFLVASGSTANASSSSETTPLVVTRDPNTSVPSTNCVSFVNDQTYLPQNAKHGSHMPEDDITSPVSADPGFMSHADFMGWDSVKSKASIVSENAAVKLIDLTSGDDKTYIQQGSCSEVGSGSTKASIVSENAAGKLIDLTSGDDKTNIQQGSCSEVGSRSTNAVDESLKCSLVSENDITESNGALSTSSHGCSVDQLEEIIEDAKSNKKTLLTVMESVMDLMKEVELQEKDAEKSKEEATRGGLDTLQKVEELKKMLEHAKEANGMHAGEVYGEKSILATEVKELENRLINLSEDRNKSLDVLDAMRNTLVIRLAEAIEMKKAAEEEKREKEEYAVKALVEQEAMMEKVVQESKLLQKEAEENSKLREFLMDRGQIVDSLQGEISVICQDVNLLKEKFDNRVSLTKSISSSQTSSSCGSSSMRRLVLEELYGQKNGVNETSNNKSIEAADSSMDKEKDDRRELVEDGWEWENIFDKETGL